MTLLAVLAGGAGRRFEGTEHKLLTPWRGRPLLWWTVDAARRSGAGDLVVVAGALPPHVVGAVVPPETTVVDNPEWDQGQATSLQVVVRLAGEAGHDAVVVGLGDQLGVPAAAWSAVADSPGELTFASFGGRRRPPTRIARSLWPLLPTTGDEGARALARMGGARVEAVACPGTPSDIDTMEDLRRWS